MWTYEAPVADMQQVLSPVLNAPASWATQPDFADLDAHTAAEVRAQAGRFAADLRREASACHGTPALQPFAQALTGQLDVWQAAIDALRAGAVADADYPLCVADDLLAAGGPVLMAWAWARIARTARLPAMAPAAGGRSAAQWTPSATFGLQSLLPQAAVHWARVMAASASLPFVAA